MYMDEFYSPRKAIENIFRKNLIGIDIDTRAKQLATFALLMKAAQRDRSFLDARVMPRVLDMPEPFESLSHEGTLESYLTHYFLGADSETIKETVEAFELLRQSKNLGSIMKFEISDTTRYKIKARTVEWENSDFVPDAIKAVLPSMDLILALTDKYTAVVANPPYMGGGNMNKELSKYVESNYKEGKADLFSVFMLLSEKLLTEKGKYGMLNMQSWMFLTSFEELRKNLIKRSTIDSLLHLGPRTFDELAGEVVQSVAFVVSKSKSTQQGVYFRLLGGKNCIEKEELFKNYNNGKSSLICYVNVVQSKFYNIPGCPIAYWVNKSICDMFSMDSFDKYFRARHGLLTGHDKDMVRNWTEVSRNLISFDSKSSLDFHSKSPIYAPLLKGGTFRKWYGNMDTVVKYDEATLEYMKKYPNFVLKSEEYYFKEGLTWTLELHNGNMSIRYMPRGVIFSNRGASAFGKNLDESIKLLGFLSSKVASYFFAILSPTLSISAGTFNRIPIIRKEEWNENIVQKNIEIGKQDWDAHETSWNFQCNELLSIDSDTYIDNINYEIEKHFEETGEHICIAPAAPQLDSLEWRMEQYKTKWERNFMQLHKNEEELNRQFIDIYGLQDELTPGVPLNEITILQQGEISIENNAIVWNDDVVIKQLISYAIGCWMGRYRLDKPGLNIAYYPEDKEICSYKYYGKSFTIDDDGIIPLMGGQNPFEDDNAIQKMVNFVHIVFGDERLTENLNFIEHSLGKSIEDYLTKDFWKDHKKMYQNRPIYWLFSSKKGAFQVLVYMHRMNPYTAEKVRTKYLLPYIEYLQTRIQQDNERGADLTTIERKNLTKMEAALVECQEYHDRLHSIADKQINFDLDDGVVVNYAKFGDVLAKIK